MDTEISEKEQERRGEQRQKSLESNRLAYSLDELVRITGVSRSKIYLEVNAGRLRRRKMGSRAVFLHTDAMDWLESLPAEQPMRRKAKGRPLEGNDDDEAAI